MTRTSFILAIAGAPLILGAQDTSRTRAPAPPPPPRLELSGVMFANYQSGGPRNARAQNRFDVERVYLTVYAPAGDRVSIRFTSDIFVQRDSTRDAFYRGWSMRAKYAWLQYELMRPRPSGATVVMRAGLIHTPIAEYEETFFLRYISGGSTELAGFFSTADAGIATSWMLPKKRGELYLSIVNGNGYTSRETDRFKDFGGRLSITPFGAGPSSSLWTTLSLTPWYYKGWKASTAGATAGDARRKDRYGFFAGVRDPRLRAGIQLGRRTEENDVTGSTIPVQIQGSVTSAFIAAKPGALADPKKPGPIALVLRTDFVRPDDRTDARHRLLIAGVQFDLSTRASMSFDMQVNRPLSGSTAPDTRIGFLHLLANF